MKYTHNKAILIRLLQSPNEWVGLPDLHQFTKKSCDTSCMNIHSRISDLRLIYKFEIDNQKIQRGSVKESSYRINLTPHEVQKLREMYVHDSKTITAYSEIFKKSGVQSAMFAGVGL
jgi:hypothetical protein